MSKRRDHLTLSRPVEDMTAPHLPATRHLPSTPGATLWGYVPGENDPPVLTTDPGDRITIDTVNHEGILEDQGRDPVTFFGRHGVDPADVPRDAIDIAVARCAANAVELLGARFSMAAEHAYAYLRAATDFDISQVVDQVKGVHARIRRADF